MPLVDGEFPSGLGVHPWLSVVVVGGALVFAARGLFLRLREHRRCKAAALAAAKEVAAAESGVLAPGETVVVGKVELADGEQVASRVEIEQIGTESESSGSWYWTWSEVDRRVTMRPFYIRHASGHRVRVEPSSQARLVDRLDRVVLVNETTRTRIAELSPGERVFASGVLSRGRDPESDSPEYRSSSGAGWVLRPPRTGDMLLSSENLEDRFVDGARRARLKALPALVLLALFIGASTPFLTRLALGTDTTAEVVEEQAIQKTDSDGDPYTVYSLLVRVGSQLLSVESDREWNKRVEVGTKIPFRHVPAAPTWSALGHGARLDTWGVIVGTSGLFMGATALAFVSRRKGRWFEGKQEDSGNGRLAENKGTVRET